MKRQPDEAEQKPLSKRRKQKTGSIPLEKCLNQLAWLLEESESNCIAVCLVNNKLLISGNNIFYGTTENSRTELLKRTVNYLSCFVSGKMEPDQRKELI